ncbi:hypothetical protein ANN_10148 [Periplaneta americana]|uniref:Uncharacterized protein n=1 Tax=Periplaneta americana TaxID=6978 RepID=A0ABQ8TN88_PERAM|nr:hypothetical protein ANN_10148 [Periplaneta americana]
MDESRNAYKVLVGKHEGERPLGRSRSRWEDDIKMDLRELGYDGFYDFQWRKKMQLRKADCNSDHYLVGELRETLSVAKRVEQQVNISKFYILKLKDEETKQHYQVEISNRFATLGNSDELENELDVNSMWEIIRDSIKIAAEQSIDYYETKKKKPWFDEDCCMVVERRKRAKLKFLQDAVEENRNNYFNERWEASRTLRNKKRDCLKEKLNEIETNSKNKNIRDLYNGIKEFKNEYQARVNVIKDENGDLLAVSHSILNRWKNYSGQLLNVHRPNRNDRDEIQRIGIDGELM